MINFRNIAFAAALALGTASTAQAVTFTDNIEDTFTFTFDLFEGESEDTGAFGIAFDFDLTILSVTGDNPLLGYFIDDEDGRLTNDDTCAGFGGSSACDLIFGDEEDGKLLFTGLSAGEYNFGIFGGTVLSDATITFGVSKVADVPLPAGGLLLLGGLGALGLKRRRKS